MLLAVGAIAFAFYAPSLRFGFFNDDPTGHFRWMQDRSLWSLLTNASGHGYYRPLSFILWQILHALLGRHDPFVLHLLNLLAHAGSAALLTWLASRLSGRWTYGVLAGLLFALYPFSYEAVPYVGSFVHPLVTFLILLSLAFFFHWWRGGQTWAFIGAHVAFVLAVFTQENAVITPLLVLALVVLFREPPIQSRRMALSFLEESLLFAVIWLLVPKTATVRALSLQAMSANILPFIQGLVYPLAPLANHNPAILALIAIASLIGLLALARYARVTRLFAFGLLVWALASLPSILLLDPAYVAGSPRLFYLGSVGVALLWALPAFGLDPVLCALRRAPYITRSALRLSHLAEPLLALLILAVCYLPTAGFVRCQLAYQGMAGEVGQMMARATQPTSSAQLTFVNLPYFFSSRGPGTECKNPFLFAPTGAVVIPPYAQARDFVFYNGGPDLPSQALIVREYQPGWSTFGEPVSLDQLHSQLSTSRVFVFDLLGWKLFDLGSALQPAMPRRPAKAVFGGIELTGASYKLSQDTLTVTLQWQSVIPVPDRKVFVHVSDATGRVAAQHDGTPAGGFVPTSWWLPRDMITDTHTISLSKLPAGRYWMLVGMYNAADGQRIQGQDARGMSLPDDQFVVDGITRQ